MIFKKEKEILLDEVFTNVQNSIHNDLYGRLTYGNQVSMNDLAFIIQQSVAAGVQEGIRTILENQYTDDDFERDLTLK